jgi:hypothetical protein
MLKGENGTQVTRSLPVWVCSGIARVPGSAEQISRDCKPHKSKALLVYLGTGGGGSRVTQVTSVLETLVTLPAEARPNQHGRFGGMKSVDGESLRQKKKTRDGSRLLMFVG